LSDRIPAACYNQVALAKSKLFDLSSSYSQPDSLIYLDKLPVQFKEKTGFVFFFKYKSKKDDNVWKLASVGIVPNDASKFEFEIKSGNYWQKRQYNFTEFTNTKIDSETPLKIQLKKALKKMQYSRRNSAAQFYKDEDRIRSEYYPAFNLGD